MNPTMPDPFSSHAQGVTEIPIREVISRLASIVGGQLTEYVAEASLSVSLLSATDDVTAALDHLLTLWDDRERLATPTEVAETVARHNARLADEAFLVDLAELAAEAREPEGRWVSHEEALPEVAAIVRSEKDARQMTAHQAEAAERHLKLQAGET